MALWSPVFDRLMKLSRRHAHRIGVEADIPLTLSDGVCLKSDRFFPRDGRSSWPTLLIRTPYGRRGLFRYLLAYPFARRGFQVILQSIRGTHDAEGVFDPFHHERSDGLETVEWLEGQPWFDGCLIAYGVSYTGYANWAIASELGDRLAGVVCGFATCSVREFAYPGGCFLLHDALHWAVTNADGRFSATRGALNILRRVDAKYLQATHSIPVSEADQKAIAQRVSFFQDWVHHHPPEDPWWDTIEYFPTLKDIDVPVLMVAGWQDVFCPLQIRDYLQLKAHGCPVSLHIGPWNHTDLQTYYYTIRASLPWMRKLVEHHGSEISEQPDEPHIRVFMTGGKHWTKVEQFPAQEGEERWYLHTDGGLSRMPPEAEEQSPSTFTYDPKEPTPMVGGPSLAQNSGYRNQNILEQRDDVLVFTSPVVEAPLSILGPPKATIYTRVSSPHFDVFVRICDVDRKGRSINLCEGIQRFLPDTHEEDEDGVCRIQLTLSPMGHVFQKGHRIRVQVSGGSHPRFVRNLGTDEPLPHAVNMVETHREIFHEPPRASSITLPLWHDET